MKFRTELEVLIADINLSAEEKDAFVGCVSNDYMAQCGLICHNNIHFINAFNKLSKSGRLLPLLSLMEHGKKNGFSLDPALEQDEIQVG